MKKWCAYLFLNLYLLMFMTAYAAETEPAETPDMTELTQMEKWEAMTAYWEERRAQREPEDEEDLRERIELVERVENSDWGDQEYWEVDPYSERRLAFDKYGIDTRYTAFVKDGPEEWYQIECDSLLTEAYEVSPDSQYYAVINGVLFSKDLTTLYCYPAMKKGWYYQVPSTVKTIAADAFFGAYYLRELVIPDSVTTIEEGWTFVEACVETIHFPPSITSEFDPDQFTYLPYIKDVIVCSNTPVAETLRECVMEGRYAEDYFNILYYE